MSRTARVALGFAYFYLVMTGYYILKPVRESFFMGEQGYQNLPVAHLLVMAATFVTVHAYARAARRVAPGVLVAGANASFLVTIAAFWGVLGPLGHMRWLRGGIAWVYYCWVSVFAVFAVTLFWSLVHAVFDPEEGSRSYGIIGAGGTLGALTGGYLTRGLAQMVGTENLLLIALVVLAPCLPLGARLSREGRRRRAAAAAAAAEPAFEASVAGKAGGKAGPAAEVDAGASPETDGAAAEAQAEATHVVSTRTPREIFAASPYLCVLGAIVTLTIISSVLDEYRYNKIIQESLTQQDVRTSFYGSVYYATNVIGLFFSLVVSGPVLARFGPRPGILLYCTVVTAAAVVFPFAPVVDTVFWAAVANQSVAYSIYQWSRELCYSVTTAEEKFVAKSFIDTFLFRVGGAIAALGLLATRGTAFQAHAATAFSAIVIPTSLTIAGLGWWISDRFLERRAAARS